MHPYSTLPDVCSIITVFIVHRPSVTPNSAIAVLSFDNGYGRYFGYDSRDGSQTSTDSYTPACFVGVNGGYCKKFKRNNGTGPPIVVNSTGLF